MGLWRRLVSLTFTVLALFGVIACPPTYTWAPGNWGWVYAPQAANTLQNGPLRLTVTGMVSGSLATNYFVYVTVTNLSGEPVQFDAGEVVLIDQQTGVTVYSVARDENPDTRGELNVITRRDLGPGETSSGKIMYSTDQGMAQAPSFVVRFGETAVPMARTRERTQGEGPPA